MCVCIFIYEITVYLLLKFQTSTVGGRVLAHIWNSYWCIDTFLTWYLTSIRASIASAKGRPTTWKHVRLGSVHPYLAYMMASRADADSVPCMSPFEQNFLQCHKLLPSMCNLIQPEQRMVVSPSHSERSFCCQGHPLETLLPSQNEGS